jgi:hypothetical protein
VQKPLGPTALLKRKAAQYHCETLATCVVLRHGIIRQQTVSMHKKYDSQIQFINNDKHEKVKFLNSNEIIIYSDVLKIEFHPFAFTSAISVDHIGHPN